MRLLSFLTDIENSLAQQSAAGDGATWQVSRMVNYHRSLARMTLSPVSGGTTLAVRGTILLESFVLADGSPCVKASLAWEGHAAPSVVSVYAKPQVDWAIEAARVAATWLAGPAATALVAIAAR